MLVVLALAVGGCSSSSSSSTPAAAPSPTSSGGAVVKPVASKVQLGKVAGTIKKKNRKVFAHRHAKQLVHKVGRAVDTWLDGGFVGVDYPRHSFPKAFVAFTSEAKHDAWHQRRLMTNWSLRKRIDGVQVTKRRITLDVLAPRGRPAGVTARVALVFKTTGDVHRRVGVHGRLFLSPNSHGKWKIFGYDVAQGGK